MMKQAFICLILVFVFTGCNDLKDYYETINQSPIIEFLDVPQEQKSFITDSLKVGYTYSVKYKIEDEENLSFNIPTSENYSVINDDNILEIKGLKSSKNEIILSAVDSYNKNGNATIGLTIFDNLQPIAKYSYQINELEGSYFITLDASLSYDKDEKFGGAISSYEFSVNSYTKVQTLPLFKYSVNKGSTYTIMIRVKDNSNAWSHVIIEYITI